MNKIAVKKVVNRRGFLGIASSSASMALGLSALSWSRVRGANDRISLGVIGCGGRFASHLQDMKEYMNNENIQITALCDVWKVNLNKTAESVKQISGKSPQLFSRFNDLLNLKNIDGVFVTAPDHVHCPALIAACKAGKDVFCEKPMSRNFEEAIEAVDVVHETKRIVQIGTQRRSDPLHIAGAEFINSGRLGTVSEVNVGWNDAGPRWDRDYSAVKREDVDWEGYLINTPKREFDARRFRCWHLYRDYTVGVVGLLGAHLTDVVMWFMNDQFPVNVTANGGTFVWKNREHMDTIHASFTFPKGFLLTYETRLGNSSRRAESLFYGTNGTFDTNTWTMTGEGKVSYEMLKGVQYPTSAFSADYGKGDLRILHKVETKQKGASHVQNWIQCMRTRKQPNATVEHGFSHSLVSIMAHEAADSGKRLIYDQKTREIREG